MAAVAVLRPDPLQVYGSLQRSPIDPYLDLWGRVEQGKGKGKEGR